MSSITINGKTYRGKSVSIIDGKVFIDGKESESNDKKINIVVDDI